MLLTSTVVQSLTASLHPLCLLCLPLLPHPLDLPLFITHLHSRARAHTHTHRRKYPIVKYNYLVIALILGNQNKLK